MSLRVDTSPLISGALVVGHRGLGVLGSAVPSSGDNGAGYLYNDLNLPADASKEVRGLILTQPSAGSLFAYEDSSFEFSGAPDGSYSFTYRLYVDGVDTGTGTSTLQVGSPVATVSAVTASPVFSGSANQSASCQVSVTTASPAFSGSANQFVSCQINTVTASPAFSGSASVDGTPAEVTISVTTASPVFGGSASSGSSATITTTTAASVFSGSASGITSTIARPNADISNTGWTPSTGSDLYAMLDEVSPDDADYISTSTLGAVCKMSLNATAFPGGASQQLNIRASSSTGNGLTVVIKDGATTIASRTLTLTPTFDLHTITLTSGEIAAITSGNLTVEMTST